MNNKTATEVMYEEQEKSRIIREQEYAAVMCALNLLHSFGVSGDEAEARFFGGYTCKELEGMVVSGFFGDEVPYFRDGVPRHELEEPVNAAMLNNMVKLIQIMKTALETIRREHGQVCDGFELCHHQECASSVGSWLLADKALRECYPLDFDNNDSV